MRILPGDLYCPYCLSSGLEFEIRDGDLLWSCAKCWPSRTEFSFPYGADADDRFTWLWDDEHPKPNPGCPWCDTCNITGWTSALDPAVWTCKRQTCRNTWRGSFSMHRLTTNDPWIMGRWLIRVPTDQVPFIRSGDDEGTNCSQGCEYICRCPTDPLSNVHS